MLFTDGCYNGGVCVNFTFCMCRPGFLGDNCEYMISDSCSNMCWNNGTCVEATVTPPIDGMSGMYNNSMDYNNTMPGMMPNGTMMYNSTMMNNGTMMPNDTMAPNNTMNGFCHCQTGYRGSMCQYKLDLCNQSQRYNFLELTCAIITKWTYPISPHPFR